MDKYELIYKVAVEIAKDKGVSAGEVETYETLLRVADIAVKNCSIPNVANQRKLLLAYSEWWDKNYSPLRLDIHRQKDIEEFLSQMT